MRSGLWLPGHADPTRLEVSVDPRERRMRGTAVHGNTPFDVPFVSPIAANLWQGGCADGLVLPDDIVNVVSLYPWERYVGHDHMHSVLSVVMHDALEQGFEQVDAIAGWVNAAREDGPTLVHCQAGLNRSSLVVARALMLEGMTADAAITAIRAARSPACLCNQSFEQHLRSLDDGLETVG